MGQGAEPKHKLEESNFEEGEKKKIGILREKRYYSSEPEIGYRKDTNSPVGRKFAFEITNRLAEIKNAMKVGHKIEKIF